MGSLLEVGTGFHPELTGRENIFLNGAILGMRKEEIKKKFDEIVVFSEVEKFLDTLVKRYSSDSSHGENLTKGNSQLIKMGLSNGAGSFIGSCRKVIKWSCPILFSKFAVSLMIIL